MKFYPEARGDPFRIAGERPDIDEQIIRALGKVRSRGRDRERLDLFFTIIESLANADTRDLQRVAGRIQKEFWSPTKYGGSGQSSQGRISKALGLQTGPSDGGRGWDNLR